MNISQRSMEYNMIKLLNEVLELQYTRFSVMHIDSNTYILRYHDGSVIAITLSGIIPDNNSADLDIYYTLQNPAT